MRILAFTDIHGKKSLVERIIEKSLDVDLVVCCGDLSSFGHGLKEVSEKLSTIKKRLLIIPGNNETNLQVDELCRKYNWVNIHGETFKINECVFAGVGGSTHTPFRTPFELKENEIERILVSFKGIRNLVLVTHSPPHNTRLDEVLWRMHVGSVAIRKFIEEEKPILTICGHVHEKAGLEEKIGETKALNPGGSGLIIEIKGNLIKVF